MTVTWSARQSSRTGCRGIVPGACVRSAHALCLIEEFVWLKSAADLVTLSVHPKARQATQRLLSIREMLSRLRQFPSACARSRLPLDLQLYEFYLLYLLNWLRSDPFGETFHELPFATFDGKYPQNQSSESSEELQIQACTCTVSCFNKPSSTFCRVSAPTFLSFLSSLSY
jgi:hypothetical protein